MTLDGFYVAVGVVGIGLALFSVIRTALAHRLGADLIALLALVGALAVGEALAAALISVMLATGLGLEARASARAGRELHALLDRQPRYARRKVADEVSEVPLAEICRGDLLVVAAAEVVGVDGRLVSDRATLDESALTGEPLPNELQRGEPVRSGVVNAGGAFEMRATATSADSTYAGILRLVEGADATSAPLVRLADRAALIFLGLSLALSIGAWAWSGELSRAVAVLVVATPCPLILAVPVAISSGLSAAARRGVVVKGGAVLERLAQVTVLLLDKTGTVTMGRPTVCAVVAAPGTADDDVLRWAASLDQLSSHVIASGIVRAAIGRGLRLGSAEDVVEVAGSGTTGRVDGRAVRVGRAAWLGLDTTQPLALEAARHAELHDASTVAVEVDQQVVGVILLSDRVRPDAGRTLRWLRHQGVDRIVLVTGDRSEPAEVVGRLVGVDSVAAKCSPADKVEVIRREQVGGVTVMVGDGINDAPALAAADIGVAMGARGGSAATEAADVVLGLDRLDRLGDAVAIAQRSRQLARQSVGVGMGLSVVAMGFATAGLLPATWGALLQEVIDVAVILNALRAIRQPDALPRLGGSDAETARRFSREHSSLQAQLDQLLRLTDSLGASPSQFGAATEALRILREELEPHEVAEEKELYPLLGAVLGGNDPTSTMSRAHLEISRLIDRLEATLTRIDGSPEPRDIDEVRRLLYGLHAILQLHTAQEEEGYLSLADPAEARAAVTPLQPGSPRQDTSRGG